MSALSLPPIGPDWTTWARQASAVLSRLWPKLQYRTARDTAAENGLLLWDEAEGYPVVALSGAFLPVCIQDQLLLKSPNGTLWRIQVNNIGVLTAALA